jgi:hypothetical protein
MWLGNFVAPNVLKALDLNRDYGGFHKWWYRQIIHFNEIFHYKPSIWRYPHLYQFIIYGNPHMDIHGPKKTQQNPLQQDALPRRSSNFTMNLSRPVVGVTGINQP